MPESLTDLTGSFYDLEISGQTLRLHAGRFAEWREEKTLFVADAHLGKIEHFRRAGLSLPDQAGTDTFSRLSASMEKHLPERLIFLGDLFHSDFNDDFPRFAAWRNRYPATDVMLIPGNHDRAGQKHLHHLGIRVESPQLLGPFYLRHEPGETENGFLLCGHLHPAVSLSGKGRQHLRMPAFWLSKAMLCLPSFGSFTGSASIHPAADDVFFAIAGSAVRRIPGSIL